MLEDDGPTPLSDYSDLQITSLLREWDERSSIAKEEQLVEASPLVRFREKHRPLFVLSLTAPFIVVMLLVGFWMVQPTLERLSWCGDSNFQARFQGIPLSDSVERERVLGILVQCNSRDHRMLAAQESADGTTLSRLSDPRLGASVVTAVAENGATPPGVLEDLADVKYRQVRVALINNPQVSKFVVSKILKDDPDLIIEASSDQIAEVDRQTLVVFASQLSREREILAVLSKRDLPDEIKELILANLSWNDLAGVAKSKNISLKEQILDTGKAPSHFRKDVALFTTDPTLLGKLALDQEPLVREVVARKASYVSEDIQRLLAEDADLSVRMAIAGYSGLATKTSKRLANDPSPRVRSMIARFTPRKALLTELASDEEPSVRISVVENINVSSSLLRQLSNDSDDSVSDRAKQKL